MSKPETRKHWVNMPEFEQNKKIEFQKITVRFDSLEDLKDFSELIGQPLTEKTKSIWFPRLDRSKNKGVFYGN